MLSVPTAPCHPSFWQAVAQLAGKPYCTATHHMTVRSLLTVPVSPLCTKLNVTLLVQSPSAAATHLYDPNSLAEPDHLVPNSPDELQAAASESPYLSLPRFFLPSVLPCPNILARDVVKLQGFQLGFKRDFEWIELLGAVLQETSVECNAWAEHTYYGFLSYRVRNQGQLNPIPEAISQITCLISGRCQAQA